MQHLDNSLNIKQLTNDISYFPSINEVNDNLGGIIAVGGNLSRQRLINAYKLGIFPWYTYGEPILWYHPNPRMVIDKKHLKISKSLQKTLNNNDFIIKQNQQFSKVITACATIKRQHQDGTWITDDMLDAYIDLHKAGYAHSIEVYQQNILIAGLYGVAIGGIFFGESMFTKVNNASKIAFVHLVQQTKYSLVDCQVNNNHLQSLGAINISRDEFMTKLKQLI